MRRVHKYLAFTGLVAAAGILALVAFITSETILVPTLDGQGKEVANNPLFGSATNIPVHEFFLGGANPDIEVTLVADDHNFIRCDGVENTPVLTVEAAVDAMTRYWSYEYTGEERVGHFPGKWFISEGEHTAGMGAYRSFPVFTGIAQGKTYYVMSSVDLRFKCGTGIAVAAVCGNGVLQAGEQCDDDNIANGDGCSATCTTEVGYSCSGVPSVCQRVIPTLGEGHTYLYWIYETQRNPSYRSQISVLDTETRAMKAVGEGPALAQSFGIDPFSRMIFWHAWNGKAATMAGDDLHQIQSASSLLDRTVYDLATGKIYYVTEYRPPVDGASNNTKKIWETNLDGTSQRELFHFNCGMGNTCSMDPPLYDPVRKYIYVYDHASGGDAHIKRFSLNNGTTVTISDDFIFPEDPEWTRQPGYFVDAGIDSLTGDLFVIYQDNVFDESENAQVRNRIYRINPDTLQATPVHTEPDPESLPGSILIDSINRKMYWKVHRPEWSTGSCTGECLRMQIRRANLDGTNMETVHSLQTGFYSNLRLGIEIESLPLLPTAQHASSSSLGGSTGSTSGGGGIGSSGSTGSSGSSGSSSGGL